MAVSLQLPQGACERVHVDAVESCAAATALSIHHRYKKPSTPQRRTRALRVLALRELIQRHDRILHPVVLHLQASEQLREASRQNDS